MGEGPTHSDSSTKTHGDQGNGLSVLEVKHKIPNAPHQGKKTNLEQLTTHNDVAFNC